MKWEDVADIVAEMTCLKFFPTDEAGQLAIMKLVGRMAENREQVRWLVDRIQVLFDEWPGPRALRLVFCKKFKPQDGIDISGPCDRYPAGIPSETTEGRPFLALPSGHISKDLELNRAAHRVLEAWPEFSKLAELPPAERKRALEFERILDDLEMGQDALPEIKRKPRIKQSEIQRANADPDPVEKPRPEGTYQKITRENFDALLRLEQDEKQKKAGK